MTAVVDSRHQELDNDEIISIAAMETGSPYSPEQVKASLIAETQETGAIILRQGNTLFVVHKVPNREGVAVFRALNADTAQNYIQNSIMFLKAMASMAYTTLVTQFHDESLLNIFKYISRKPPLPGMGYMVQKTSDGGFRVTVNLGNGKAGGLPNPKLKTQEGNI